MSPSSRRLPLSLGLLASGALLLVALYAHSQPASPSATASAAPSPSGTPDASPPFARGAEIPAETSDVPKTNEWETAKVVRANQDRHNLCSLKVLREWVRFECKHRLGAALVAGDPADVKIWGWGELSGSGQNAPRTLMTMRLRRGDAKIFELYELGWTYEGYTWHEPAEKLSVMWREGKEDPVIVIQR